MFYSLLFRVVLVSLILPMVVPYAINNKIYDPDEYQKLKGIGNPKSTNSKTGHYHYKHNKKADYETTTTTVASKIKTVEIVVEDRFLFGTSSCRSGMINVGGQCIKVVNTS